MVPLPVISIANTLTLPVSNQVIFSLWNQPLQSYLKLQPVFITYPSSLRSQKVIRTVNRNSISPLFSCREELYFTLINSACSSDMPWIMKYEHKWHVSLLAGSLWEQTITLLCSLPTVTGSGTLEMMMWEIKYVLLKTLRFGGSYISETYPLFLRYIQ